MTDTLEAQARELVVEVLHLGWHEPMCESPHCLCATARKYAAQIAAMTAWLPRAEGLAVMGSRPPRLPYVLAPFPVPVVLGVGLTLPLFIVLGRN